MAGKLAAPRDVATVANPDWRAAIVAALGTVPGLVPGKTVPDVPTEGAAWPTWVQDTYGGVLAIPPVSTWDVYVLLPAGYSVATVDAADSLRQQIVGALWLVGSIQMTEPVSVRFENQTAMPGFRIRLATKGSTR